MNALCKLVVMILISMIFSGCQADHEKTLVPAESHSTQKMDDPPAVHEKIELEAEVEPVIESKETVRSVDLNVSDKYLKQLGDNEQDSLAKLPPQAEKEAEERRKIKVSGGVLLDNEQEQLTDKLDGGKVNISIPMN